MEKACFEVQRIRRCYKIRPLNIGLYTAPKMRLPYREITSKAVPTPKELIKNHKKHNLNGEFSARLAVQATNFTAGFSKLGYLGHFLCQTKNLFLGKICKNSFLMSRQKLKIVSFRFF